MKNPLLLTGLAGLLFCFSAADAETDVLTARVLKNNVNLRARALKTSEVVGQASKGALLAVRVVESGGWRLCLRPTWICGYTPN